MIALLFLSAFVAWSTYRIAILCDAPSAPRIARIAMAVLGLSLVCMSSLYSQGPWWARLQHPSSGWEVLLILFMLSMGPVGVWCLGLAIGRGWFTAALAMRRASEDNRTELETKARREAARAERASTEQAFRDGVRRERIMQRGAAAGRLVGRLLRP